MSRAVADEYSGAVQPVGGRRQRVVSAAGSTTGLALTAAGIVLLVSAAVDLTDGGTVSVELAVVGIATTAAGFLLGMTTRLPDRVRTAQALAAVTISWLTLVVVGAIAFLATGPISRPDDALFEAVASFTTTAATLFDSPETLARGTLFWRATSQWMGGFGALVVIVVLLPTLGVGAPDPSAATRPHESARLLSTAALRRVNRLSGVYLALTGAGAALYLLGGMGPFDAVIYAFGTISTGGFAGHREGFAHFDSAALEWFAIGGMVIAGASFALLWRGLRGLTGPVVRSAEVRSYLAIVVAASLAFTVSTASGNTITHDGFRESVFTAASAISTTGFFVTDWGMWPEGAQLLLMVLMGIGAMSGSAGGGFRVIRTLALLGYVRREILRQLHAHSVLAIKVGQKSMDEAVVSRMIGYQVLFVLVVAIATIALATFGADLVTAGSAAISALSTTGAGLGEVAPPDGLAALDAPERGVVMVVMTLGRLEIYPILITGASLVAWLRRGVR